MRNIFANPTHEPAEAEIAQHVANFDKASAAVIT
jgi:hypothetical protein